MAESAITHLLVDPSSPKGARTLYAAAFGRGVYKSVDNGRTWALKNDGLAADPRQQPFAWRLTLAGDGTLYLVVARRSERGRIGDADDGALYRSTDGAGHWTRVTLPAGTNGPNGLTVDPSDPKRLYLSAWGVTHPDGDTGGGVFLSDGRRRRRGGSSWARRSTSTTWPWTRAIRSSSTRAASTRRRSARPTAERPGPASAASTSSGDSVSCPIRETRRGST